MCGSPLHTLQYKGAGRATSRKVAAQPFPMSLPNLSARAATTVGGTRPATEPPSPNLKTLGILNATQIALCEIGRDIPNTCLLGALAKTTGWVEIESVLKALEDYFDGDILKRNIRNAERGYAEVEVITW